jgi:hypothetical protein
LVSADGDTALEVWVLNNVVLVRELLAEATEIDVLIAKGVVPDDGRGRWAFLAAALPEKTTHTWRRYCSIDNPEVGARLTGAALNRSNTDRPLSGGPV